MLRGCIYFLYMYMLKTQTPSRENEKSKGVRVNIDSTDVRNFLPESKVHQECLR